MKSTGNFPLSSFLGSSLVVAFFAFAAVLALAFILGIPGNEAGGGRGGGGIEGIGPPPEVDLAKTQPGIVIDQEQSKLPGVSTDTIRLPYSSGRVRLLGATDVAQDSQIQPAPAGASLQEEVVREITLPEECRAAPLAVKVAPPAGLEESGLCHGRVLKWSNGQETALSHVQTYRSLDGTANSSMILMIHKLQPGEAIEVPVPHGDGILPEQTVMEIDGASAVLTQSPPNSQMFELQFAVADSGYFVGSINVPLEDLLEFSRGVASQAKGAR